MTAYRIIVRGRPVATVEVRRPTDLLVAFAAARATHNASPRQVDARPLVSR
jgi:hypothetical protein